VFETRYFIHISFIQPGSAAYYNILLAEAPKVHRKTGGETEYDCRLGQE
jgi:hypothetical protein